MLPRRPTGGPRPTLRAAEVSTAGGARAAAAPPSARYPVLAMATDVLTTGRPRAAETVLDAYRRWGYLLADLDPLGRLRPESHPELPEAGDGVEEARRARPGRDLRAGHPGALPRHQALLDRGAERPRTDALGAAGSGGGPPGRAGGARHEPPRAPVGDAQRRRAAGGRPVRRLRGRRPAERPRRRRRQVPPGGDRALPRPRAADLRHPPGLEPEPPRGVDPVATAGCGRSSSASGWRGSIRTRPAARWRRS
jgi:hypothetical protein